MRQDRDTQMIWSEIQALPQGMEIPLSIEEAQAFLELLLSITEMLQLYQERFPDAWSHDEEQNVPIFPERGADYSQREVNFFRMVDKHYFPLPISFLPQDLYGERRLTSHIPIESMGFDLYDDENSEELPLGWQCLLYLLGEVNEEWLSEQQVSHDLFEIHVQRANVSEALLILRSEAQGGVLAYLPLAIQMLQNNTESVWLNVTMDDPCIDALWTKEDMEEISRQYHLALSIRAKAMSFCSWLEENPVRNFSTVARLWNACARDTPKRETGPRMMQISSEAFIPGIHFGELFERHIPLPAYRGGDPEQHSHDGASVIVTPANP